MDEDDMTLLELLDVINYMISNEDYLNKVDISQVGVRFNLNKNEKTEELGILGVNLKRKQDEEGNIKFNIQLLANSKEE